MGSLCIGGKCDSSHVTGSSKASSEVWHQRMGHPQDKNFIEVSSWMKLATVCVSCQLGKS